MIEFRSDNSAAVAPAILDAIVAANSGTALAYGGDEVTAELELVVREVFEHDRARVFPVTSGTAMNALVLSAMTPPWGAVWCHDTAHISVNEANATALLAGGVALRGVGGADSLVDVELLRTELGSVRWGDNHQSQPTVLSLTQPTDMGSVYPVEHVAALAEVARSFDLGVHLDGARLANALVHLECSPAELTWRAGVDAVSLGATKNGAMSAELIVVFDDAIADELIYRTKRAGHVPSKMRYQSAQLIAYLRDGYWLELARSANRRMARLVEGIEGLPGVKIRNRVDANMLFATVSDEVADAVAADGIEFYRIGDDIRLVTSWATADADVDALIESLKRATRVAG